MAWLKWHIGSSHDPKFRVIAKHAKAKIAEAIAIWLIILEHAFEHDGNIAGLDPEIIEAVLNIRLEKVEAVMQAMAEQGLISGDAVSKWENRQCANESSQKKPAPLSNCERQQKYRDKKRQEMYRETGENNGGITAHNENITKNNESITEHNENITKNNGALKEKIKIREDKTRKNTEESFCAEQSGDCHAPPAPE